MTWERFGVTLTIRSFFFVISIFSYAILSATISHSQSPQDFFRQEFEGKFGGPQRFNSDRNRRDGRWLTEQSNRTSALGRRSGSPPTVRVSSPEYYQYTADVLSKVSLDDVCEIKMASNGSPTAQSLFEKACSVSPAISIRMLPVVGKAILAFYSAHPNLIWIERDGLGKKAIAAMAALAASGRFGLSPADYRVELPNKGSTDDERLKEMLRFELNLSAKALTYVLDATRGRVDPNRISGYHDLPRKTVDLVKALDDISQTSDVSSYLEHRNPGNPPFRALVTQLAKLRANAQMKIAAADDIKIRAGDSDPVVGRVIAAIGIKGSPALKEKHAKALSQADTAEYTQKLVGLVRDFQRERGLRANGVISESIIRELNKNSSSEKIAKIELAMERLRWLPRDLGSRYVFLNQPAFNVTYMEGNKAPLVMRVVIGKPSNQTYFFTDRIKSVEYNPYWNVPRSIIVNEMLPKLYRNPSYLDRLGYEVTDNRGRQISSSAVDWDGVAYGKVGVDVRQTPGNSNALGRLKIDFPNKHAIYLHDTPNKQLFKRSERAFSHGCVRLHDPRAMAAAILGTTKSYIDRRIGQNKNATESVSGNIPIYLAYFTAWPGAADEVHYYDDVYGRDGHLTKALVKTAAARRTE